MAEMDKAVIVSKTKCKEFDKNRVQVQVVCVINWSQNILILILVGTAVITTAQQNWRGGNTRQRGSSFSPDPRYGGEITRNLMQGGCYYWKMRNV